MDSRDNTLSNNIRHLRKSNNLSQEELATKLGIKRSNIAAYESKNVEPRLRIILELAKLFDISVKYLIDNKLEEGVIVPKFNDESVHEKATVANLDISNNEDVEEFIVKSVRIRKVLEGFKSFYTFKKSKMTEVDNEKDKIILDIENFIQLMEHLLAYNETVIKAITNKVEIESI